MANRSLNAGRADSRTNRDARGDSAPRPLLKPLANFLCGGGSIVISLLLFVVVVGVFLPSLRNGFVNLDDDVYVFANPHVQSGLSWENIRWAFGNFHAGFWHPLTWLSLMLDRQLFGLRPFGFHLTAVLLHAASTLCRLEQLKRDLIASDHSDEGESDRLCAELMSLLGIHVGS